ncbi:hypothetical protein Tco_0796550 [Tanacetum coccineum]
MDSLDGDIPKLGKQLKVDLGFDEIEGRSIGAKQGAAGYGMAEDCGKGLIQVGLYRGRLNDDKVELDFDWARLHTHFSTVSVLSAFCLFSSFCEISVPAQHN